jgi:hypothetical protein
MKIIVRSTKPRNPFVALARARRSGRHQPGAHAQRQLAGRALQRELERMKYSP